MTINSDAQTKREEGSVLGYKDSKTREEKIAQESKPLISESPEGIRPKTGIYIKLNKIICTRVYYIEKSRTGSWGLTTDLQCA